MAVFKMTHGKLEFDMKTRWHLLEIDLDKDVFTVALVKLVGDFFLGLEMSETLTAWITYWQVVFASACVQSTILYDSQKLALFYK